MELDSYIEYHLEAAIFNFRSKSVDNEMFLEITMRKYSDEDSDIINFTTLEHIIYLKKSKMAVFSRKTIY